MRRTVRILVRCRLYGLLALGAMLVVGCGGGGGGGMQLSGNVSRAEKTDPQAMVAGAGVKAYLWPDLTNPVGQATTDANGKYALDLPGEAQGKDVVLIAELPAAKVLEDRPRLSAIVTDVPGGGKTVADLDSATTLAAEAVIAKAKAENVPDLTGPAVETITAELRAWEGIKVQNLNPDGPNLPAAFGGGLKTESETATFLSGNPTVQKALAAITDGSPTDVRSAKRMIQMLRDMGHSLMDTGVENNDSVDKAAREQQKAIEDGLRAVSHDLVVRVVTVCNVLWWGGMDDSHLIGGSDHDYDTLGGKAPGQYEWRVDGETRTLVKTGNAPDGKSWIVVSKIPGVTLDWQVTITPQNPVAEFHVTPKAGSYTVAVRKPGQPDWKWDATLAAVLDANNRTTKVTLNLTASDPDLTKPLVFNGTITGLPVGTYDRPDYAQISLSGNLSSQFVSGELGELTVRWTNNTHFGADLQDVTVKNFKFTTGFSKTMTASVGNGRIEFYPADPLTKYRVSAPKKATLDTASFEASGHKVTLSNAEITFDNYVAEGRVTVKTRTFKGALSYVSPKLTFNGSLNATWDNLAVFDPTTENLIPLRKWPIGTVNFEGTIQPVSGTRSFAKGSLVFDKTDQKARVTLNLEKLEYGSESMAGSLALGFAITGIGITKSDPVSVVQMTQSPSSYTLHMEGVQNTFTGYIAKDAQGAQKLAQIGKASDLQLGDLGGTNVIKYSDDTFETMASILPF